MDLAMYLEVGMFFLMSTIVIGGALGLITCRELHIQ